MPNPFDWDYLTTAPASGDVLEPFAVLYLFVFAIGFVVSVYLYYRPWTPPFGHLFRRKSVIKATGIAMWVFGIGVFFFLIRILQIDPLSFGRPIWMWLSVLAVVGFLAMVAVSWSGARRIAGDPVPRPSGRRTERIERGSSRPVRHKKSMH